MRASKTEWEDFVKTGIWLDIKEDIETRMEELKDRLADGNDKELDHSRIRGRIDFCNYLLVLPSSIIIELEEELNSYKVEKENEDVRPD